MNAYYKDYCLVARRLNLKTGITNPFFEIIMARTNIRDKRRRRIVLSHLPTRFAIFAISTILLMSSLLAIQSNQSAWAGTFPGPNGQIAFVRGVNGEPETYEIYIMNADGNDQTRLTDNSASDGDPSWSPDGTKIAFDSTIDEDGNRDIYIMNADDGSGQTRLTDDPAFDTDPSWSPDGTKIAFSSNREDDNSEIYIMNSDGSGQTRLTDNSADDFSPSWSPDSEKIAFVSDRDNGNFDIYIMNADDGSGQTRLTDDPAFDGFPSWSPDSEKIAFTSNRDSGGIFVMNADDGSGQTRLTDNSAEPSWSPDSEKIAFTSNRDSGGIFVMNADDGSGQTRLTDNSAFYSSPDWGTNTSPPDDDGSTTTTTSLAEQPIDKAISTIQNLDNVPQSLKTSIIDLLEDVSNMVNNDIQITIDQALAGFLVP
jgi:Tol biopolymer transport system component